MYCIARTNTASENLEVRAEWAVIPVSTDLIQKLDRILKTVEKFQSTLTEHFILDVKDEAPIFINPDDYDNDYSVVDYLESTVPLSYVILDKLPFPLDRFTAFRTPTQAGFIRISGSCRQIHWNGLIENTSVRFSTAGILLNDLLKKEGQGRGVETARAGDDPQIILDKLIDFYIRPCRGGGYTFMSPVYVERKDVTRLGNSVYWTEDKQIALDTIFRAIGSEGKVR